MFCGVPLGATIVFQTLTSKPGTVSATVGTSGSISDLLRVVTASARNLPDRTCSIDAGRLSNITCTCPAIMSVSAGAFPRYGTCTISTPVATLNNSPDKCWEVPTPADAKLTFPGFAFAYAMNSATDFAGTEG